MGNINARVFSGNSGRLFPPDAIPSGMTLYYDGQNVASLPGAGGPKWYDISGNGNTASFTAMSYSTGNGGFVEFDGTMGHAGILSGSVCRNKGNQTFSTWFYQYSTGGEDKILFWEETAAGANYTRKVLGLLNQQLKFGGRGSANEPTGNFYGKISNSTFNLNTWYNFTAVWDVTNTTIRLYLNGAEVAGTFTGAGAVGSHADTAPLSTRIGSVDGYNVYVGRIGQLLVYDRILTNTEILNLYSLQRGRFGV